MPAILILPFPHVVTESRACRSLSPSRIVRERGWLGSLDLNRQEPCLFHPKNGCSLSLLDLFAGPPHTISLCDCDRGETPHPTGPLPLTAKVKCRNNPPK